MTGYVDLVEQVEKDFHRALLKASLRRWKSRLRRNNRHERLLSFEEAESGWIRSSQAYLGIRAVEVEKITGSVGRYKDFDRTFLPRRQYMSERWCRVDRAYHQRVELPAVSLYKIGEAYFVVDGNHRVSVARYHGARRSTQRSWRSRVALAHTLLGLSLATRSIRHTRRQSRLEQRLQASRKEKEHDLLRGIRALRDQGSQRRSAQGGEQAASREAAAGGPSATVRPTFRLYLEEDAAAAALTFECFEHPDLVD